MATTYLTRTETAGSRTKWTWSCWFKWSGLTAGEDIFASADGGGTVNYCYLAIQSNILRFLDYTGGNDCNKKTTRVFRDPAAWYNVVLSVDTTLGTAEDRCKIYINGVRETSFSTNTNWSSADHNTQMNVSGYTMIIGRNQEQTAGTSFDGSMSHIHFIDGTAYDASAFGETDSDTGEWKIKTSPSVTYGTNGFFILKDGNGITDQSGESNNFTLGAGTLTNTEDNPSNVFCTLNPLNNTISGTAPVFSNGNNTVVTGTSSADFGGSGTFGLKKGVWYYEGLVVTSGNDNLRSIFGIISNPAVTARNNQEVYYNRYSYCWKAYNGAWWTNTNATNGNGTENVDYLNTYTNGDYIGIYFDLDNSKMLFTKNGTLERSGVSMSITAVGSTDTGFYFPIYTDGHSAWSSSAKLNFGNGSFGTTSLTGSENSDWFRV